MAISKNEIIKACADHDFFKFIYDLNIAREENNEILKNILIELHNANKINIISEFLKLKNGSQKGVFFLNKQIFEEVLPEIYSSPEEVMRCVLHLKKEAGSDMTSGMEINSFIKYCEKDSARPKEIIQHIKDSPGTWLDFVSPVIEAGSKSDCDKYVKEAIELLSHYDIEIRKRAIFSFCRINFGENTELIDESLKCLKFAAESSTDDEVMGNVIRASFFILEQSPLFEDEILKLIEYALSKGKDYSQHVASEILGFYYEKVPEPLEKILLHSLKNININNKDTIDNIDQAITKLLKKNDPGNGLIFLEKLLTDFPELSLNVFDGSIHTVLRNKELLNKVVTRWLLKGDAKLCVNIGNIVNKVHGDDVQIEADENEIPNADFINLVFIGRKVVGYLFMKPITCCSMIISLMKLSCDDEIMESLGSLLFDPISINYTGKAVDYLKNNIKKNKGKVKKTIQSAVKNIDEYLENLQSIPNIPELYPSQEQRESSFRRSSMLMAESYKSAMKGSIVNMICTKQVILYGASSINHIHKGQGEIQRMEVPMQKHGTTIEMPRINNIDPFGLDYMLRTFRTERIKK